MQEISVLAVDVGPTMGPHLPFIRRALSTFLHDKMVVRPHHEVGIICFGTTETQNDLHMAEEAEGTIKLFGHITTCSAVRCPDMETIRVSQTMKMEDGYSNFVDALAVAMDLLKTSIENDPTRSSPRVHKRIILFSDLAMPPLGDVEEVKEHVENDLSRQFLENNVRLEVVSILPSEDMAFALPPSHRDHDGSHMGFPGQHRLDRSVSELLLSVLTSRVRSMETLYRNSVDIMGYFRFKEYSFTSTLFNMTLDIGDKLKIAVKAAKKISRETLPTIGKVSPLGSGSDVIRSSEYYRVSDKGRDDAEPVQEWEQVRGFRYNNLYLKHVSYVFLVKTKSKV